MTEKMAALMRTSMYFISAALIFTIIFVMTGYVLASDMMDPVVTTSLYDFIIKVIALYGEHKSAGAWGLAFVISQALVLSLSTEHTNKLWLKLEGTVKFWTFTVISSGSAFILYKYVNGETVIDALKSAGIATIAMQFLYQIYDRHLKKRLAKWLGTKL